MLKPGEQAGKVQRCSQPPSGGCVLKQVVGQTYEFRYDPAAFRRLCVETNKRFAVFAGKRPSRLQAAVC